MLERAKANRQRRLASQKETTREFLREEGLKNTQLDSELVPVQKAVFQLAKSGASNNITLLIKLWPCDSPAWLGCVAPPLHALCRHWWDDMLNTHQQAHAPRVSLGWQHDGG
jgi:hypothetical protein